MAEDDEAYLTFYIEENINEKEANKNPEKAAIDALAKTISYLEDRIANIEKIILGSPKKEA